MTKHLYCQLDSTPSFYYYTLLSSYSIVLHKEQIVQEEKKKRKIQLKNAISCHVTRIPGAVESSVGSVSGGHGELG